MALEGLGASLHFTCAPRVLEYSWLLALHEYLYMVASATQPCLMALCNCLHCYADPPLDQQRGFPHRSAPVFGVPVPKSRGFLCVLGEEVHMHHASCTMDMATCADAYVIS